MADKGLIIGLTIGGGLGLIVILAIVYKLTYKGPKPKPGYNTNEIIFGKYKIVFDRSKPNFVKYTIYLPNNMFIADVDVPVDSYSIQPYIYNADTNTYIFYDSAKKPYIKLFYNKYELLN